MALVSPPVVIMWPLRRFLVLALAVNLLWFETTFGFATPVFICSRISITRLDSSNEEDYMERAFAKLNDLDSIDADFEINNKIMEDVMKGVDLQMESPSAEEELKLYRELYNDLDQDDDALLEVVKKEIENQATIAGCVESTDEQLPTMIRLDNADIADDAASNEFLNQALEQAMKEIQPRGELSQMIRQDKDLMKEIEAIFDKGNDQLLANLEEIRNEQVCTCFLLLTFLYLWSQMPNLWSCKSLLSQNMLARASAERSANRAKAAMAVDQGRLEAAQSSVSRIIGKVRTEEAGVQKAVADLQKAQAEMNDNPLIKLSNLKQSGVAKQGALVGALLFGSRAIIESVAILGLDGESHASAALIQGVIAFASAAYFFMF